MALIFGDVSFDMRQFGHLMPSGLACRGSPFQTPLTTTALRRTAPDQFIHPRRGGQSTPVAGMTRLTAGIARTLLAAPTLAWRSRQSVRGWRFGGCCRVLPPQPQLTFQIGDLLFRFGQLPLALRQLLPQTLVVPTKSIQLTFRMSLCLLRQLI